MYRCCEDISKERSTTEGDIQQTTNRMTRNEVGLFEPRCEKTGERTNLSAVVYL